MFEYFNDKAIKSVILAQEEARKTGHNLVGSEHLLLGVMEEGTSTATKILTDWQVKASNIRQLVEEIVGRGAGFSPANIPFTPKVKSIFEQALQEARQLDTNYISPEHILLAIAKQIDTLAAKMLIKQGVDLEKLRIEIIKRLGEKETVAATQS